MLGNSNYIAIARHTVTSYGNYELTLESPTQQIYGESIMFALILVNFSLAPLVAVLEGIP